MDHPDHIEKILSKSLKARHRVIFDWLCEALNKDAETLICEMVRNGTTREMDAYRNRNGNNSASSKNIEDLT